MKLKDVCLDSKTLKYIEYLTREKKQKALDKYLKWTGWYEIVVGRSTYRKQVSVEKRLAIAAHRAKTWRLI
jgi:hypothetical protein